MTHDRSDCALWPIPPEGHPAYPSAVKRTAVELPDGIVTMDVSILCHSTLAACDKLVAAFKALNERMRESLKNK